MTVRERFLSVLNFQKPEGGIPTLEWAPYWDKTLTRWSGEGIETWDYEALSRYFGLDVMHCISVPVTKGLPAPAYHGAGVINDEKDYERLRSCLLPEDGPDMLVAAAKGLKERHDRGEIIIRLWLDGFFWYPRSLLGIENHLYAFYDQPDLIKRMNEELAEHEIKCIEALFSELTPDFAGFAEDMSYNNGPMLSEECFDEFLKPYYLKVIPHIKKRGVKVMVDTDGLLHDLIPWLRGVGVDGIYPLERQSGVDVNFIRQTYPDFLMLGGFDKMTFEKGRDAIKAEFERLLPVIESGGYIPSMDHQTPPSASLEDYKYYVSLLKEYCKKYSK